MNSPKDRGSGDRHRAVHALEENIQAIKVWEKAALHHRSPAERVSERMTRVAASGYVIVAHLAWFGFWIVANVRLIPDVRPFDPFPFPLLTTIVSLEAIFLTLIVLSAQNRLAQQADKRANLDLQIDLLAEREMTIVLRLVQDIARHLHVKESVTAEQIRDLMKVTDLQQLTHKMDEIPDDQ